MTFRPEHKIQLLRSCKYIFEICISLEICDCDYRISVNWVSSVKSENTYKVSKGRVNDRVVYMDDFVSKKLHRKSPVREVFATWLFECVRVIIINEVCTETYLYIRVQSIDRAKSTREEIASNFIWTTSKSVGFSGFASEIMYEIHTKTAPRSDRSRKKS